MTFYTPQLRKHFTPIGRFTGNGATALINDSESPITFVVIKSAPPELPDAAIIARLKCFGDVLSFRRAKHYDTDIENGNCTARMRLCTAIPSYIRIACESLSVYYNGQSRTCRHCNRSEHQARNCNYACFNCDQLGHYATACTDALRCSICKSTGHKAHHCPFALIDALDEKVSITTSLVRALEAIPFSLESESESDNEDHGNLDDAATLERYLINTESSSTASTVRSSVAQNTAFLFSKPDTPDINFASGSPVILPTSTPVPAPQPSSPPAPQPAPRPAPKHPTTGKQLQNQHRNQHRNQHPAPPLQNYLLH